MCDISTPLKHCHKCKQDYPATLEFFGSNKGRRDGLTSYCRSCESAYRKRYLEENRESINKRGRDRYRQDLEKSRQRACERTKRHYQKNKDEILAKDRARYWKDPDRARDRVKNAYHQDVEVSREKQRTYRRENPHILRNYYERNREAIGKRTAKYRRENPALYQDATKRRRAREADAEGTHTNEDVLRQLEAQKHRCWWCHKPIVDKYHADHLIPLSRGGSDGPGNIVIAHPKCNQSKNNKLPHEWNGRLL